jgi:hypothetical protein
MKVIHSTKLLLNFFSKLLLTFPSVQCAQLHEKIESAFASVRAFPDFKNIL